MQTQQSDGSLAKVEVVSVLGFASVLVQHAALIHSQANLISRSAPFYRAPNGDCGSVLRGRFSLQPQPSFGQVTRRPRLLVNEST